MAPKAAGASEALKGASRRPWARLWNLLCPEKAPMCYTRGLGITGKRVCGVAAPPPPETADTSGGAAIYDLLSFGGERIAAGIGEERHREARPIVLLLDREGLARLLHPGAVLRNDLSQGGGEAAFVLTKSPKKCGHTKKRTDPQNDVRCSTDPQNDVGENTPTPKMT